MQLIRSAFVGLFIAGGATVASAQVVTPAPRDTVHAQHAQRARHAQHAQRARHGWHAQQRGLRGILAGAQRGLFKGIALSDAERARVKAVREQYQPRFKALRESLQPQFKALREARQRGDTAAMKAIWDQNAAKRDEVKALLEHARDDYRNALEPAHRTQFDANVREVERRVAQRAMHVVNRRMKRGDARKTTGSRG